MEDITEKEFKKAKKFFDKVTDVGKEDLKAQFSKETGIDMEREFFKWIHKYFFENKKPQQ